MIRNIIFIVLSSVLLTQCTKKVTDTVAVNPATTTKSWRSSAPQAGPARDISLGTYSDFDLPNGLKVIVVENHKLPRVSYQLSLNNEALIEGDKAGYTSFAGDLLSKGTTTRTKAQIDEAIDFIGASLNTSATGVFGSSLKKHSSKLLDVMTDVLYNPSFPKDEFEKIRKRTASNLVSAKTDPQSIASNIKSLVNYGEKHPYGEVQSEETIKNITVEDCKNYYNTYFKPNNAYLVIVGDITPTDAKAEAEKYFGNWKRGNVPTQTYSQPEGPKGAQVRFGNKDGAVQSVIDITYPISFTPGNADAIKATLMNSILGGGIFSGRLMQNLREKKAYTYGARSSLSSDRLTGNFSAGASVRNEVTDSSLVEFIYELNRIVKEPVTEADLKLAKSSMIGNFGRSLESPQTIANFALNTFRYNLPRDYYNNYVKNVESTTISEIQEMARKYIKPENCNIIVVGNKDNTADKLKRFDSDGKIDYYDAYGKKLEDAPIKVAEGTTALSVINDYITNIGGKDKLMAIKTMHQVMSVNLMGQNAIFETHKAAPNKFAMTIQMMGNKVQEQFYDGSKGYQAQMGQVKEVTDEKQLNAMREQAVIFDQIAYLDPKYKLELKGIENVDGENCYKILVTDPNAKVITEFYSVKTGLMIRTVKTEEARGQQMTITSDFTDYKSIDGIMIPHKSTVTGMMPQPLVFELSKVELNKAIDENVFKAK